LPESPVAHDDGSVPISTETCFLNRALIVRLGALGDIVHAIPVAAALRQAFPSAQIDWLVSAKHREILDLVPVVDRRVTINDRADAGGGLSLFGAVRELRRRRYDVAFDLQGLIKSAVLARASGASRVVGFGRSNLREPLARVFYSTARDSFGAEGAQVFDRRDSRHVVELNLGLLQAIGVNASTPAFPLDRVESAVASTILDRSGGRYALLNPGAAWPNKRWPPGRFADVAVALRERHDLASVILWGPGERELAEETVQRSQGAALLTPQTSIADVVALARGARVMVSGDTGPTHIGAAVGAPIVGLYGPTRPARNGPWAADDVVVSRAASCECHHLRRCRRQRMCLLDIEVGEVLEAVEKRLAADKSRV